ncbi:MAG: DUF1080 domain-containing protein [Gemmataceae bacterium]|nr:DUF1080 domain-containing protein [Gemmataceae bacterium]MDW8241772.1 DUF1080 domain-containing protein [Thermogemmata sp.]
MICPHYFVFAATSLLLLIASSTVRADDTEAFLNPANWEGLSQYWKLDPVTRTIIGHTDKDPGFNTFFCSKKAYGNFELTFEVQLKDAKGNSGVQIRSRLLDGPKEKGKYIVAGPQADIGQQYWGSLYGERFGGMMKQSSPERVKKLIKPDGFNEYRIRVVGKRVTIVINGETFLDEEFEKLPPEGIIAFQIHAGGPMTVTFRNIRFMELQEK